MPELGKAPQIAEIQLVGHPYQQQISQGDGLIMVDSNASLDILAHRAGYEETLPDRILAAEADLVPLFDSGYYGIDAALKHGRTLDFNQTFSLISFVCSALNRPLAAQLRGRIKNMGSAETHELQAVSLLSSMSTKEAYAHLTAEEIAGMVAATIHLDTVERTHSEEGTIAFGGMGGDLGYPAEVGQTKLFSLSTLAAVVLSVERPTHKHHSYPNTSKVAGQSAIEAVGARSDFHSPEAFKAVFDEAGLIMSSCHNTRTLHTLSHKLKGETINHVIGPLAFTMHPETPIHGLIGVNEKVHPQTIVEALQILHARGYQRYDNSAVYCGTDLKHVTAEMLDPDAYYKSDLAKSHVRVDEIAPPPYASLVAFSVRGADAGTYESTPDDFYTPDELRNINFESLLIPNVAEEILRNNAAAIAGEDLVKAMYLAMTVGLGIFTRNYLHLPDALDRTKHRVNPTYLRFATKQGLDIILSGGAKDQLDRYVAATQKHAGN